MKVSNRESAFEPDPEIYGGKGCFSWLPTMTDLKIANLESR
jgi:hypothetical protein